MSELKASTGKTRGLTFIVAQQGAPAGAVIQNLVTIKMYAALSGMTTRAIEGRIYRGDWLEGRQYHRSGGCVWIDRSGVEQWILTGKA